jgi:serine O-acetyltransferase
MASVVWERLREDVDVVFERDPAARSRLEVILTYPGVHALILYRGAHWLWLHGWKLPARALSYFGRFLTGVDIHPGAIIGRRAFIDHGMGVVIGETAEIGDDVLLYQGVTLGGTGKEQGKRHPTIGNNVVIGTGAKVLGNIEIGAFSKIGAGSVVVHPVPPNSTVVGIPGRVVRRHGVAPGEMLEHGNLPDPEAQERDELKKRVADLEESVRHLIEAGMVKRGG